MAESDLDVIRRANEHISETGDLDDELYDPEVEYTPQPDSPIRATFRGMVELRESLARLRESWQRIEVETREFVTRGDPVVALLRFRLTGRGSDIEMDVDQYWVYWMRDGRIWRVEQHGTEQSALASAGLLDDAS